MVYQPEAEMLSHQPKGLSRGAEWEADYLEARKSGYSREESAKLADGRFGMRLSMASCNQPT